MKPNLVSLLRVLRSSSDPTSRKLLSCSTGRYVFYDFYDFFLYDFYDFFLCDLYDFFFYDFSDFYEFYEFFL